MRNLIAVVKWGPRLNKYAAALAADAVESFYTNSSNEIIVVGKSGEYYHYDGSLAEFHMALNT